MAGADRAPYIPSQVPIMETADELRRFLEDELKKIAEAFTEFEAIDLRPIFAEPAKPREGMIVFADGTEWNPGAGAGCYEYEGGTWNKL